MLEGKALLEQRSSTVHNHHHHTTIMRMCNSSRLRCMGLSQVTMEEDGNCQVMPNFVSS